MRLNETNKIASARKSTAYDSLGRRLYVTDGERHAFLDAAHGEPAHIRLFCTVIALTGSRLSEALRLTPAQIDPALNLIVFETLKRRQSGVYRHVPIPCELTSALMSYIVTLQAGRLWPISRATGWRWVKQVMAKAEITGPQATAKGLRHGFGVSATHAHVPLSLVQRWLGHARLSTTVIYTSAVGPEERGFAERMWATSFTR